MIDDSIPLPADVDDDEEPFLDRVRDRPGPALVWVAGVFALLALEFGAVASTVMALPWDTVVEYLPAAPGAAALAALGDWLADLPTLLSRDVIPNQGYNPPGPGWEGTFLGLSPGAAWALRVALVYAYATAWLAWLWRGYLVYRRHYRYADWTPTDDMIDRLRGHRWGQFGAVVVFAFLVLALFAPALGPTTVEANIQDPFSNQISYYDENAETVVNVSVGNANLQSSSQGNADVNVGPMTYDDFGRFHPFGTLPSGKDMFTFMAAGARVSLFIALLGLGLAAGFATAFALVTAYYKGLVDLAVVLVSDSVMSLPVLLLLILLSSLFGGTWIAGVYNGALLLALIFAATWWPYLWRAIRGPAFQIAEQEWVDAARSYGQKPRMTMQKHMFPYVLGYLLVYASMSLGGVIISVAGLSFIGLGVHGVPEWGQAINAGQDYVVTASWHVSLIPGVLIVLVVTAFNALGDGIRDAVDPQSQGASDDAEGSSVETAATGGGA